MNKTIKKILLTIITIWDIVLLIQCILNKNYTTIGPIVVLPLVLALPSLIKKIFKIPIGTNLEITFILFVFLAQFLGSCINLYNKIYWYDNFTHFLSGIFSCFIAIYILKLFNKNIKKDILFNVIFIFGIVFTIACCWEFIEFSIDNILKMDTQHSLDTGVFDTMIDMICACLGAILFNILYVFELKSSEDGIIIKTTKNIM